MKKVKYYYDAENLAYRKIKTQKGRSFGYIALFLVASALFGFLCFVALLNTPYFETPKDKLLARENENLKLIGTSAEPLLIHFKTNKLTRDGIEYDGMERNFFGFRFVGDDREIKLQDGEIRSYKWVSFADLKDYLLFENQLEETTKKIAEIFHTKHSPSFNKLSGHL